MSIIPDPILALLQVLPFLVLMLGMHLILFKPMLAYLSEREHATTGARKQAHALAERAEAKLQEYEAALAAARAEVAEFRTARRAEAQASYNSKVTAARSEADKRLGAAMGTIQNEARTARSQIGAHARSLAQAAASQVLGRALRSTGEA